jgi:phosphatidylserine/phosphatidylglycerophosphate/cardiolipin synthase-like enzyme
LVEDWFLSPAERGNPDTEIDSMASSGGAWTEGNLVQPLVDGVLYFRRLRSELEALERGDSVWFTEWRGDRDELLSPDGPTVGALLASIAGRGIDVRGLLWRSHPHGEAANRRLEAEINHQGGQVLLDQRVLPFGSHHQKLVLVRHQGRPSESVAFVGGIDICHGRRDDIDHGGDPQPMGRRYGPPAPWHDAHLEVRGPAVAQLEWCFRERWADPTPLDDPTLLRGLLARLSGEPKAPSPLPAVLDTPLQVGSQAVQVLRTYPRRHRPYPFARQGEFSTARALIKAIGRAERLIYIEDQYLWSRETAEPLAARLAARPALQLLLVLPRWPHGEGTLTGPPNRIGQLAALARLHQAGGARVGAYDIENPESLPTYVHAKVCIIDDIWAMVGSANFNLRSWTHDSELSCAVLDRDLDRRTPQDPSGRGDGARVFARSLRLQLWSEHLGRSVEDPALLDLDAAPELWRQTAVEVARWHRDGAISPHPPARITRHVPAVLPPGSRWWAERIYRTLYDPDSRSQERQRLGLF